MGIHVYLVSTVTKINQNIYIVLIFETSHAIMNNCLTCMASLPPGLAPPAADLYVVGRQRCDCSVLSIEWKESRHWVELVCDQCILWWGRGAGSSTWWRCRGTASTCPASPRCSQVTQKLLCLLVLQTKLPEVWSLKLYDHRWGSLKRILLLCDNDI